MPAFCRRSCTNEHRQVAIGRRVGDGADSSCCPASENRRLTPVLRWKVMYKFAPENLRQSLTLPPPSPPSRAGKLSLHSVTGLDPGTPSFPTCAPHSFVSPPHLPPPWSFPSPSPSAAEDTKDTLTPFLEACFDSLSGTGAQCFASLFVHLTSRLHRGHRVGCFYRLGRLSARPAGVQAADRVTAPPFSESAVVCQIVVAE